MAQHPIARLDEIDELADLNYRYRPVRHHFGISSLGVAAWTARETGDAIVGGYDEDSEPNEELFVVVSGCAVFHIDGESVEAPAGALVYTPPGRTTAVATEPGTTFLAVGGSPGKAYDATGWELWAPPVPPTKAGSTPSSRHGLRRSSRPTPSTRCWSTTWHPIRDEPAFSALISAHA